MKNKALALGAAIVLSAGIAFSFINAGGPGCCEAPGAAATGSVATEACCDMPTEDCPIPCCKK